MEGFLQISLPFMMSQKLHLTIAKREGISNKMLQLCSIWTGSKKSVYLKERKYTKPYKSHQEKLEDVRWKLWKQESWGERGPSSIVYLDDY